VALGFVSDKGQAVVHSMWLNRAIAWGLLVVGLLASAAGSIFNLYAMLWWFDEALHFFLPFAVTLVLGLYAYGALVTGRRHEVLLALTIAGLGLALGTLWELVEWIYDAFAAGNSIKDKTDTMIDLTANLVGGVAAGILSLIMLRRGRLPRLTSL
jgi:hypothetical protein